MQATRLSAADTPTIAPPRHALARTSGALFLAGFATFSLIYCTQPLLPAFCAEFGISPAVSSLALSLTTGLLALSILCVGAGSEAWGRRGLMAVSMVLAAALNLVCAFAPNWPMLLALRAAEGLALGGVPAVAMAYLAEEVPPDRLGGAMGLYVGGTAFGGMMGRVAMGALTSLFSWRAAIGAIALVDLLAAVAFLLLLPPSRNFRRRPGINVRFHLSAWHAHVRDQRLILLFLVGFLAMSAFVTVYNYTGFRLAASPYGLNESQIGLIFLAYLFGMAASSAAGALTRRVGGGAALAIGAVLAAAGLGLTMLPSLAAIVAGVSVVTIGFFTIHAVASSSVGRLAGRNKGHAASLYLLAYYAGSSVMGSIGGLVWRGGGWPAVSLYCVALIAGVFVIGLRLSRATLGPAQGHPAAGSRLS